MLEIKFWLEDNWWKLLIGVVAIVVIFMLGKSALSNKPTGLPEDVPKALTKEEEKYMEEKSDSLKEIFSELDTKVLSTNPDRPVYEVSLYLKQPTILESDLRRALKNYTDLMLIKENDGKTYVKGIHYKIYDRELIYKKDLVPRGQAHYMLKVGDTLEKVEKNKKLKEKYNATGDEKSRAMVWEMTTDNEDIPNYDDYTLAMSDFTQMREDKAMDLLTDEEFAFYLKLQMYSKITGTDIAGAKLYLRWDLGRDLSESGLVLIMKDFKEFNEREKATGVRIDYFDNEFLLKQDLSLYRPQFLLFAEYGIMETDYSKAQKILIEKNPQLYRQTIENEVNATIERLDKEGKQSKEDSEKIQELHKKYGASTGLESSMNQSTGGLRTKSDTIGDKNSINETDKAIEEYKKENKPDEVTEKEVEGSKEDNYVETDKEKVKESNKNSIK